VEVKLLTVNLEPDATVDNQVDLAQVAKRSL